MPFVDARVIARRMAAKDRRMAARRRRSVQGVDKCRILNEAGTEDAQTSPAPNQTAALGGAAMPATSKSTPTDLPTPVKPVSPKRPYQRLTFGNLGDFGYRTVAGRQNYQRWKAMRYRCRNPKHHAYPRYGGRGIEICDRWFHSYLAFVEDMGMPPTLDLTIERIDCDGNYEPGNCKWATHYEQSRNKPGYNRHVEINGERMVWADAQTKHGAPDVSKVKLRRRLSNGWPFSMALIIPNCAGGKPKFTPQAAK